jgi:hypothetical protein
MRRLALLVLFALFAFLPAARAGETLDAAAFEKARARAEELMRTPGAASDKEALAEQLGADDSARAAKVLIRWALDSARRQAGEYLEEHQRREEELQKLERLLLKTYEKLPPTQAEHAASWQTATKLHVAALENYTAEARAQSAIAKAIDGMSDPGAIAWLGGEGLKTAQASKHGTVATTAVIRCLLRNHLAGRYPEVYEWAGPKSAPEIRVLALAWIGENRTPQALPVVLAALNDRNAGVRRAAVAALSALDDPAAVKPLIDALQTASGLLADEIDAALHTFTGQTFDGDPKIWMRWWNEKGAAWQAKQDERWDRNERRAGGGASFYGIETRSERIVFVVDRSGSMKAKAGRSASPDRGPTTGGGEKAEDPVKGETNMDVAKNQLARSIDGLGPRVAFNVIFYGTDVQLWKPPPAMLPARPDQKQAAKTWFTTNHADGSTQLFAALTRALEYGPADGKGGGGADTIYLLSDGSPTDAGGAQPLAPEEIEKRLNAFLDANRAHRFVVHTIGIGPQHNRWLMERIAQQTGGKYVAVAAD